MNYSIDYEKGVVNAGNDKRIASCMLRAMKGEPLKLAFLGGSITQGSLASTPKCCYAYRTYNWWKKAFPLSDIAYINAGIGGTSSHLGTARVEEDVLRYHADFIIVEFAVNDQDDSSHFMETYEGLIRRILKNKFCPALLLVHNVRYDDGKNAEQIHGPVGEYYDVPSVSMKSAIYPYVAEGKIALRDITSDNLHPNDKGHKLVADVITHYLDAVKNKLGNGGKPYISSDQQIPKKPITKNGYEDACRLRNTDLIPSICTGFIRDDSQQSSVADFFKKGWSARNGGDRITFEVYGASIAVQYRKTIRKPAPIAKLTLDGDANQTVILDANFNEDWGDCLYLETILHHGTCGKHTVDIEVIEANEENNEDFYLVSIIIAGKKKEHAFCTDETDRSESKKVRIK